MDEWLSRRRRALAELHEVIVECRRPYPHYSSDCICLAVLRPDGFLELLSPAWESLLGFSRRELDGRQLFAMFPPAAGSPRALLRRIVDPAAPDPVRVDLCQRSGAPRPLVWHRRFDDYDSTLFIVGEAAADATARFLAPIGPRPA
jgi:hypothetical protein